MSQATQTRERRNPSGGATETILRRWPGDASRWVLLLLSAGTIASAVLQRVLVDADQSAQHAVELNVGEAFAAVAVASLVLGARGPTPRLGRADLAVLVCCALAWMLPEAHAVYLGTTAAGVWCLVRHRADRLLRDVAQVWVAVSFYELWGKLLFKMIYQTVEPYEVGVMYRVGGLFFPGISRQGVDLSVGSDWSVVILEGCSSFHNLSLTALLWLCTLKVSGRRADRMAFGALAVSAGLVVAINVGRILVMLPSESAYRFWHEGSGSTYVALASVIAAVAPILVRLEAGR